MQRRRDLGGARIEGHDAPVSIDHDGRVRQAGDQGLGGGRRRGPRQCWWGRRLRLAARSEVDAIDEPCTLVTRHAEHSGNELISFEDCQRVFDKVRSTRGTEHLHAILREKSAEVAAGLARSHAASGNRIKALRSVVASIRQSWRYPRWWIGALRATAQVCAPPTLVAVARRRNMSRSRPRGAPLL